jgi:hypothetical protein
MKPEILSVSEQRNKELRMRRLFKWNVKKMAATERKWKLGNL